jgi:hypothetical protein
MEKIMKVKWTGHKTNEEVPEIVQKKRVFIKTIRDRQKKWVGHVLRGDSPLRVLWQERMEGKRVVGRPREKLLGWMTRETKGRSYEDLTRLALDRGRWRMWDLGPI